MKKISLLFCCLLSVQNISAAIYSGSCGDNVRYKLDTETGVLSITGIGTMKDYSSRNYVPWYSRSSYINTVNIADGVTSIGWNSFSGCSGLTSITIPNSVTSIGWSAFSGCSNLKFITIPNSVTTIGNDAFYNCFGLTSITIPNSMTEIGSGAFCDCSNLESVYITDIEAWCKIIFKTEESNPLYYAKHLFIDGKEITNLIIPNDVKSIKDYAFYGCSSMTSITIPNSVTSIGYGAFDGTTWYENQSDGLVYAGKVAYAYKGNMPNNASIIIKEGTLGIASCAFSWCSNLTSITIPNSVTTIGNSAFGKCTGLTSITIPNSVTSIGWSAFSGCSNLKFITIPNSVTTIETEVFKECTNLTKVELNSNAIASKSYSSDSSLKDIFGDQVKEYIVGDDVESIGDYAFAGCSSLTSVTIPNSVTAIGGRVFYGCSSLKSITCKAISVPLTENSAFEYVYSRAVLYVPYSVWENYKNTAPWSEFNNIRTIEKSIISGSCGNNVNYALLETGVLFITGTGAMTDYVLTSSIPWDSYHSDIKTIYVADGVTSIGNMAFYGCSILTSITIPNSVTSIGNSAFNNTAWYDNQPDGLVYVGKVAYKYKGTMPGNTSIMLKEGTLGIAVDAFNSCSDLTSITIPNSVTAIGRWAFEGCSGLTSVTCEATSVPLTGSGVFNRVPQSSATLYVPAASVETYKKTSPWSGFGSIVAIGDEPTLRGDVNGDDIVNGTDIQAIINFIVTGEYDEKADVNKDNIVNGTDIQEVINIIVKTE